MAKKKNSMRADLRKKIQDLRIELSKEVFPDRTLGPCTVWVDQLKHGIKMKFVSTVLAHYKNDEAVAFVKRWADENGIPVVIESLCSNSRWAYEATGKCIRDSFVVKLPYEDRVDEFVKAYIKEVE